MMFGRGLNGICNFGNNGYYGGNDYFNNGMYGYMHYGLGILVVIGILIFAAVIIYLLVHKSSRGNTSTTPGTPDPVLEALKMKYVRGEITEEEYLRRKDLIGRN
ncbi:MAG TPA: SHOCT domain-containing protein [Mobilitalea sp.]|nr:SHOCT domain-containing protein [Mobilitalea sp.]